MKKDTENLQKYKMIKMQKRGLILKCFLSS